MNKMEEKNSRRSFFKHISKYVLGFGTFAIVSLFGFKRGGELSVGKMKDVEFGLSEAHGACSFGSDCAGGGGQCSFGSSCAGDGGGGGGGGKCSFGSSCAGGGGQCSFGSSCGGS